jgi:hypothetical protein
MSGFIKKTVHSKACSLTSGIPTLDKIIKFETKTLTCICEDENSHIHNTLLQVFISQNKDKTFVFSSESKNFVMFNQSLIKDSETEKLKNMSIAWRYQNLTCQRSLDFNLNLMDKINIEPDKCFSNFLEFVDLIKTTKNSNFVIFSIFSPLFTENLKLNKENSIDSLLFEIKKYAKINNHFIYLSFPNFFFISKAFNYFDNIFSVKSILTLPHEKSNYNCLIEIIKSNTFGNLKINELESEKYGLILKSKNIIIEKIDIPPDETVQNNDGCSKSF